MSNCVFSTPFPPSVGALIDSTSASHLSMHSRGVVERFEHTLLFAGSQKLAAPLIRYVIFGGGVVFCRRA